MNDSLRFILPSLSIDLQTRMSEVISTLPREYGYVIVVGTGSVLIGAWLGRNVGKARKEFKIDYPTMYSDDNKQFNCIQRAHQNYLEFYPSFLFNLLVGGIEHPRLASGLGLIYLTGRIVFSRGYYSGDPEKRLKGNFFHFGYLGLMGLTAMTGLRQLGCIRCAEGCPVRRFGLRE